jgi:hypothetical protein
MPKIRTLVPLAHPKTGEQFAAGTEVDVDEEVFRDWRADGKVSSIDDEKAQEKALKEGGNFSARTGRGDVADKAPEAPTPVNASEDDDDDEAPRTRRR